jgi:hypothetical protein
LTYKGDIPIAKAKLLENNILSNDDPIKIGSDIFKDSAGKVVKSK